MKSTLFTTMLLVMLASVLYGQTGSINNTLGSGGAFVVKDGSATFLSLSQSDGNLSLNSSLSLSVSTSSTLGVIFKGGDRFMHDYQDAGTNGYNTFLGRNAGNFTMAGTGPEASYNTGIGYTLYSLTTGYENTGVGYNSLGSNTSGYFNTAVGVQSSFSNTDGTENTAMGLNSLYTNITGDQNTAVGVNSLFSNTSGFNSAFGYESLYLNTSGYQNSAVGKQSLYTNSTGANNSAVGFQSLYNNTTGLSNSAFGYTAGSGITIGSNNTCIGTNAQVPDGTLDNQVRIGSTSVTYAGVQVAWSVTSDRRWKLNIVQSDLGLDFVSRLRPVSYVRKNDEKQRIEYGFIAQELEEVLKESRVENVGMLTIDSNGSYELRYNDLLAPMVKAIQELKGENDALKVEVQSLKKSNERLAELERLVRGLETKLATR